MRLPRPAAAVAVALSGGVFAGEMMKSDSTNPATKGSGTPSQPNETQPGMNSGNSSGDKGMKREKSSKKGDGMSSNKGDGMSNRKADGMSGMKGDAMSSGNQNPGNPAEKGARTPAQPNEAQPAWVEQEISFEVSGGWARLLAPAA